MTPYLTGAQPLGLQAAALLQQRFLLGQDFLSLRQFSLQLLQSSPLLQHPLHFLVQPPLLLLDLLQGAGQDAGGRIAEKCIIHFCQMKYSFFTCCSSNEMTEPLLPLRLCLWKAAISSVFILKIFCCCSFFISSSYGRKRRPRKENLYKLNDQ